MARKHFVTFYSPGTFTSETSTLPIEAWDPKIAVTMADGIVERHGATPYGFVFHTSIVRAPVPDGEGGTLDVQPKEVASSGTYFLGGKLETLDEIEARADPKESILRSNMGGNGWPIVCTVVRGYKSTHPFRVEDFVVDASGEVTERGDDPKHVAYRDERIARDRAARAVG